MQSLDVIKKLIAFIKPLIESSENESAEDLEKAGTNLAKLIYIVNCKDPAMQFESLLALKIALQNGGIKKLRQTSPSIVWGLYRLSHKIKERLIGTGETYG